jgi:hypothetical protein
MKKYIVAITVFTTSLSCAASVANAGGLFGDGGLIGGDVGRALAPIQHQVTPILRGTVTAGSTAVGGAVGGYYGGPAGGAVGGAVGNATGNMINQCFAGQC